jgi:predicted small lipoprotein YifL
MGRSMGRLITIIMVLFALVLVWTGCGRKTPPVPPPDASYFAAVEDLPVIVMIRMPKEDGQG